MANVIYLADIFDSLNSLNSCKVLDSPSLITTRKLLPAYYKKLILWQSYVKQNEYVSAAKGIHFREKQKYEDLEQNIMMSQ